MKKTALILAITSAAAFAQAETVEVKLPTFYGKMNVTQDFISPDGADNYSELNSNASRLGLKGDFAINDDVTAIYQAEFEIDVDGDGSVFKQRNTFLGAKGGFGKVQAGVFDSALKASQGKVDQFNDLKADIKNYVTNSDQRVKNVVRYQSPSLSGVVLTFDHINGEASDVANAQSFSAAFTQENIYAAVAYDFGVVSPTTDTIRVVGQLNLDGGVQLGALWESEDNGARTADGMMLSAAVKTTDKVTLKGQYAASDIKFEGATQIALGADYKLTKNAKVFGYVSNVDTDNDDKGQGFAVGAEYKF